MSYNLTMTDFISFLSKHCIEQQHILPPVMEREYGENQAHDVIKSLIDTFLKDYNESKKKTKDAEQNFINAIEADNRNQFDDPIKVIEHIQKIASRPPFFDSEKISLAAIHGFCNDFLYKYRNIMDKQAFEEASF